MLIERIFISPERGAAQVDCESVTVRAGAGIVGDRNFGQGDYPGRNLTLVEAEEIEAFCALHGCGRRGEADLSMTRRNLVTRGIRLNELVGEQFMIGGVLVRGVELCEPCLGLGSLLARESLTPAAVVKHWVHRGGLRVDLLADGEIAVGATIRASEGR
jgi:MOSC domain-containing protein YiiM